jgi:hypothetical protein
LLLVVDGASTRLDNAACDNIHQLLRTCVQRMFARSQLVALYDVFSRHDGSTAHVIQAPAHAVLAVLYYLGRTQELFIDCTVLALLVSFNSSLREDHSAS